ncbi:MAG: hypothetical protein ISQ92_05920 [Pelagibacteraceae bacterium]|nr:hypothetical protein [Pelagibacteraceae bacterium]
MKKISKKTKFVETNHKYHQIVGVKSDKEFREKYGNLEFNLNKCLEVFFEKKFQQELEIYEVDEGTTIGAPFRCDHYAKIDDQHVIFEYNGNHHYQSPFKIHTDKRKNKVLKNPEKNTRIKKGSGPGVKYITFKIPYYMQLTKDYARYLFHDQCLLELKKSFFSEDKYTKAIKALYNTDDENKVLAPGLHTSKQTPASYNEEGLKRFLKEVDEMSKKYPSIKHQIIHSFKLFIEDVNRDEKLIIPENEKFQEWFKLEPEEKYLNCIFEREKKQYKF